MTASLETTADRLVVENLNTLRFRAQISGREIGRLLGISSATISAKMRLHSDFTLSEARTLADYFAVSLDELTGELPGFEEWNKRWCAVRDSNPEPADSEPPAPRRRGRA